MKDIRKIVLTGGPCGGKSAALLELMSEASTLGWKVLIVPETPTELISGGVTPWECSTPFQYQLLQMKLHKYQEEIFEYAATDMNQDKILIICDRGQYDCRAYMSDDEFRRAMFEIYGSFFMTSNWPKYDAIFHLQTVAKSFPRWYHNTPVRTETAEEAVDLDNKLIQAYKMEFLPQFLQPEHHVIESCLNFNEKLNNLKRKLKIFLES